jgi:hypothetical protein
MDEKFRRKDEGDSGGVELGDGRRQEHAVKKNNTHTPAEGKKKKQRPKMIVNCPGQ